MYDFRIDRIRGPVEEFARIVFAALKPSACPAAEIPCQVLRDIYEDDGRGNIRDFILAAYTFAPFELEVIYERSSRNVVNFRFSGAQIVCEQKAFLAGEPLRLVGESSTWYLLKAPPLEAERILRTMVTEVELCGLTGFKTDADQALSERRVQYILAGNDPNLVLHEFAAIEHAQSRAAAFQYLEAAMGEFPEFAAGMRQLYALLKQQRP